MRADNFSLAGFRQGKDLREGLAAGEAQIFVCRHFSPQEWFKNIVLPKNDGCRLARKAEDERGNLVRVESCFKRRYAIR
jgi:hypothetical protein